MLAMMFVVLLVVVLVVMLLVVFAGFLVVLLVVFVVWWADVAAAVRAVVVSAVPVGGDVVVSQAVVGKHVMHVAVGVEAEEAVVADDVDSGGAGTGRLRHGYDGRHEQADKRREDDEFSFHSLSVLRDCLLS